MRLAFRRPIPFLIWLIAFGQIFLAPSQISTALPIADPASDWQINNTFIKYQGTDFLTFEELKALSSNPKPEGALAQKLETFWQTPIISNLAYFQGSQPHLPKHPQLGQYLRVASWNIEKSLNIPQAIQLWTDPAAFASMLDLQQVPPESDLHKLVLYQRDRLTTSDIVILQEMEIGIKRSGYINAAEELAKALHMNYAYAPQYLEVDPVILGLAEVAFEDGSEDIEAEAYYRVDPDKFKGVFGSAVLSRYPIKHVEVHPLKYQPYDWYEQEKKKTTFLEKARRLGALTAFRNEMTREMKVGGRHYFRVDLEVPHLPEKTLTVINIHLEIKCRPKDREIQLREILSYISSIKNPVIMMGDFNAAPTDISPTSVTRVVKRTAKNPTTWLNLAVNYISPHGLVINTTRGISNITKNFNDPFASNIKVVAPNPLKSMFEMIRDFRFDDGKAFDFRGTANRSIGNKDGLLANSNQRGLKGFVTTFSVRRPWGIVGKYRLDWVFVKSHLVDPEDSFAPYRFSPHFGETLEEMNANLKEPISDHHPNVIDLPFEEPNLERT